MSGICGSPQTGRTAGAQDEQKAPKGIDRADLEYALANVKSQGLLHRHNLVVRAAEAWLATLPEPPKTKMVEVWRVEFATKTKGASRWLPGLWTYETQAAARHAAYSAGIVPPEERACIKITGPHQHEVPA